MSSDFLQKYDEKKTKFEEFLSLQFRDFQFPRIESSQRLHDSVEYSLLQEGGKRFRPVLGMMLAEALHFDENRILPWLAVIEMVHTYSLIHDDLPCMDDDDFRRGQPTNHKKFGEEIALLAGDGLLTEAFRQLALHYRAVPSCGILLVLLLSEAAGISGMVGGQSLDLLSKDRVLSVDQLTLLHELKTGALIRSACEGSAVGAGASPEIQNICRIFGAEIGLAFQLKDDLLDSKDKLEVGSYPAAIGLENTMRCLEEVSQKARLQLKALSILSGPLYDLIEMNLERSK